MNVEELSMIGPTIDLDTVESINHKRLVTFLNHFLINTSSFLNKFAKLCEQKLFNIEFKLQKLEASILILESKLNSVPGLDVEEVKRPEEKVHMEVETEVQTNLPNVETVPETTEEVIDDPQILNEEYVRFLKMIQFGVPVPAVKLKMAQEGIVDESILQLILKHANK